MICNVVTFGHTHGNVRYFFSGEVVEGGHDLDECQYSTFIDVIWMMSQTWSST